MTSTSQLKLHVDQPLQQEALGRLVSHRGCHARRLSERSSRNCDLCRGFPARRMADPTEEVGLLSMVDLPCRRCGNMQYLPGSVSRFVQFSRFHLCQAATRPWGSALNLQNAFACDFVTLFFDFLPRPRPPSGCRGLEGVMKCSTSDSGVSWPSDACAPQAV